MAEVHQTIIRYGIGAARSQAVTKHKRMLVEEAYRVLAEDAEKIGFTYSGFALTSLPHKPQKETVWRREGHNVVLLVESGRDRLGAPVGLPYGSYARFISSSCSCKVRLFGLEAARSSLGAVCVSGLARWDCPS